MSSRHFPADDFDDDFDTTPSESVALLADRKPRARRARVIEAMSSPLTVRSDASLDQIASALDAAKAHSVAVVDDAGKLLGVVTRTDLLARLRRAASSSTEGDLPSGGLPPLPQSVVARDLMTTAPVIVSDMASVAEAAERLASRNVHQLPVVLESGELVGMLTALDLARWLRSQS